MVDPTWGSPAVRQAVSTAAVSDRFVDIAVFAELLTERPNLGGARLLGRLGLPVDDFQQWLRRVPTSSRVVATQELADLHKGVAVRSGPPATSAGVLAVLLAPKEGAGGGLGNAARSDFHLSAGELLDALRVIRPTALAELSTIASPVGAPGVSGLARRPNPTVELPYSIVLESVLTRASVSARRKGERVVSSGVLMSAVHAECMTSDWARCLYAIGLSPRVLGAETARAESESSVGVVRVLGPAEPLEVPVSGVVADILFGALALAATDPAAVALSSHAMVLSQLAIAGCSLSDLVWPLLNPRLSPVELYARYVNCAGVAPQQLALAEATYRRARPSVQSTLDDYTDDVIVQALWDAGVAGNMSNALARLSAVLHHAHGPLLDRAREASSSVPTRTGLSRYFDATGDLHVARQAFGAALEPVAPVDTVADWQAIRAVLLGQVITDGSDPDTGVTAIRRLVSEIRGADPAAPALQLLLAMKRGLIIAQASEDPGALEWAASVGMSLSELAARCGAVGSWTEAAQTVLTEARLVGIGRQTPYRRRPIAAPTAPFVSADLDACNGELVVVTFDEVGGCILHRRPEGEWTGRSLAFDRAHLAQWTRRWQRGLKIRSITSPLNELLAMVGLDCAVLQSDTVHLVAGGLARGLPLAQAIAVATDNEVRAVSHLLGGLPPTNGARRERDLSEVCLVREPPLPGRWLPYAPIESDTVESLVNPVATLGGRRATRAWVQRAVTAIAGVPVPRLLHFTGHGTVSVLPSGETASAILLADAELLTPGDLAVVEAGIRTFVCAACDIAVASMHGGHDLALAALRSGVDTVVAAAWPVDDAVTTVLVTRAYHEWTTGSIDLSVAVHAAAQWWRTSDSDDVLEFVAALPGAGELAEHLTPRLASLKGELSDGDFWAAFGTYVA